MRQFTKCCNVFGKHTKKVKGGHVVTVDIATELRNKNIEVIPGWQLCRSCYEETKKTNEDVVADGDISDVDGDADVSIIQVINKTNNKKKLNETLDSLGISPIKTHSVAKSTKIKVARLKLERSIEAPKDIATGALDVSKEELSFHEEAPIDPDIMSKKQRI